MVAALDYLGSLPDETVVYNGHEYTGGNLAFAKNVDPTNPALERLAEITQKNQITTGLTTVGDEKEWNVFMRLESEAVMFVFLSFVHFVDLILFNSKATSSTKDTPKGTIMDALREQKNKFRG